MMMRVLSFGAVVGILIAAAPDVASGQISAQEGRWIVANGKAIATKTADYMKTEFGQPREPAMAIQTADLVRLVTADPTSWRFYSRDRGILVAVDVDADVSSVTSLHGPDAIARSIEAIIRQERDIAIKGKVTVVFIDSELRELDERCRRYTPTFFRGLPSGAWNSDFATNAAAEPIGNACGCR